MKKGPLFSRKLLKGAFKKYMKPSLEAINGLLQDGAFKITINYVDTDTKETVMYEADINLTNQDNRPGVDFEISIKDQIRNGGVKYMNSYGLDRDLRIYNDKTTFFAEPRSIEDFECNFPALPRKLTGYLTNLRTQQKTYDKSYFRMCIPVTDGDINYPTSVIDRDLHLVFDVSHWDMQPSLIGIRFPSTKGMCVSLKVREWNFHFYAIEDIKCIFIDSMERLSFDEFQSITTDIRLAFAFLTARHYSAGVFTLISKDKNFKKISDIIYRSERKPINGKQQLINPTELFKFYRMGSEQFKEKFYDFHDLFPVDVFGHFCSLLSNNQVLRRAVEILVSSTSNKDPLQQGILGSVALEAITELIADENENSIKPIPDKKPARTLIKRLNDVLAEEFGNLPAEGLRIIKIKLADLNKPTNKDKLLFPFQLYGITLSTKEKEILNYRNDFLHGRSPTNSNGGWGLEQIALKVHYLAGILILKYIGYSGHVIHLPSWNLLNNQERMLEIFPLDNGRLKEITEKVTKGEEELSEDDVAILEVAARLSLFMDDLIRLV